MTAEQRAERGARPYIVSVATGSRYGYPGPKVEVWAYTAADAIAQASLNLERDERVVSVEPLWKAASPVGSVVANHDDDHDDHDDHYIQRWLRHGR